MNNNIEIFCVTVKRFNFSNDIKYELAAVEKNNFPSNYITCNTGENIFYKEEYYSELTFHYWFWKNQLNNYSNETWIGFCQKRRFWLQKKEDLNLKINENIKDKFLYKIPEECKKFDAIICEPIGVSGVKFMKIFKHGFKNLLKDPSIIFNQKKTNNKTSF